MMPLIAPVRVACPQCGHQMVLKPRTASGAAAVPRRRLAAVADEPRPFREFLGQHLRQLGFDVEYFDTGDAALDFVRSTRADLAIVNVYLKGKLGVEVTEAIRADGLLSATRVILIGALFRANRFRANPTNLYGADEYIEEQIPEREFRQIVQKLFPDAEGDAHGEAPREAVVEPREVDEARRLARLILSDIIIYHSARVEAAIREDNFFEVLKDEIAEGRQYYEARLNPRIREGLGGQIFDETLEQFVNLKREELGGLESRAQ